MLKSLKILLVTIIIATSGYFTYIELNPAPCSKPIKYSMGKIDSGFNLSETQFLIEIERAARIWSDSIGIELFRYDPQGELKINLIYDYRQQSTNTLKEIGSDIQSNQETYNQLKNKYASDLSEYNRQLTSFQEKTSAYSERQAKYSEQVNFWNSRGGAPKGTYENLQKEKSELDGQRASLETEQKQLSSKMEEINSLVNELNYLSKSLNLNIAEYNTVGDKLGSQFEEGVFVSDENGERIDIFEFQNPIQLTRLIAHELGHALGIEHVEDEQAIMNWLNASSNLTPTTADISSLKAICKIN